MTRITQLQETHYDYIASELDSWWGGRNMVSMLPRLWFKDFADLSLVAVDENDVPTGFLVGYISSTNPQKAYVHFIGVSPRRRKSGLGTQLYQTFFDLVRGRGCHFVEAVTSPANQQSLIFHERIGFDAIEGARKTVRPTDSRGHRDYDGPGEDRVLLRKTLDDQFA